MALEDSWKQLQHVHEVVRYADAKAGLILTLNGVLVGLVVIRLQSGGFIGGHPVAAPALILATALLAASVAWDIAAVMPRQVTAGDRGALLHFERIGEQFEGRPEDYVEEFVKLADDADLLQREIAAQVWATSVLARRKYRCVQWGLRYLAAALAVSVFAAVAAALGG
ncbi:Pycsar system effector family protein [Actinoplanes sp. URMC 104]|uniref:Pycsar system effector family protein n=1 Tax=Actinoplanes sp. URMC 104 TaxID=3423409 RepID=UPI003F1CF14B